MGATGAIATLYRGHGPLLHILLVLLEPLFQRFEFLACASQYGFLNLELVPSYKIQFAEPGSKY